MHHSPPRQSQLWLHTRTIFFRRAPGSGSQTKYCAATNSTELIKLTVKLEGTIMKALLDSGSQANYISPQAIERAGLLQWKKEDPYPLHVANGEPMPNNDTIKYETRNTSLIVQEHREEIDLDVLEMATHDLILGLPWLRKHNPRIDWIAKRLSLRNCRCTRNSRPTQLTTQLVDEKSINNVQLTSTKDAPKTRAVGTTDTGWQPGQEVRSATEKSATLDIPPEYKSWKKLFEDV